MIDCEIKDNYHNDFLRRRKKSFANIKILGRIVVVLERERVMQSKKLLRGLKKRENC